MFVCTSLEKSDRRGEPAVAWLLFRETRVQSFSLRSSSFSMKGSVPQDCWERRR